MQQFRGYPVSSVRVAAAGRVFELLVPANSEQLIETPTVAERFENDEYLPYWAQLWPASRLLANAVARCGPAPPAAPLVLELGCGLGLVSLVLSYLGYRVLASDFDDDALAFVAENARRNNVPIPETRCLDWRDSLADLAADRIVAADVLYETRHLRPVAEFVAAHLLPGGLALVADPNRSTADDFATVARHCGLLVDIAPAQCPVRAGSETIDGRMFYLTRKA